MKKFALALVLVSLAVSGLAPATARAATINKTIHIAARGAVCETQGYISPDSLAASTGDILKLQFKNEQPVKLEVMGIPGGTFQVPGNTIVERNFAVAGSFEYSTWLTSQDCMKAKAHITVSVASHARNFVGFILFMGVVFGTSFYVARKRRNRKQAGKKDGEPRR